MSSADAAWRLRSAECRARPRAAQVGLDLLDHERRAALVGPRCGGGRSSWRPGRRSAPSSVTRRLSTVSSIGRRRTRRSAVAQAPHDQLDHAAVALEPADRPVARHARCGPGAQLGHRPLDDRLVAQAGQHRPDVADEGRVGADDQHVLGLQPLAHVVQQPRRPVEADDGLAGARAALDDEQLLDRPADDVVLGGLDRGDDVAQLARAAAAEALEQRVVQRRLGRRLQRGCRVNTSSLMSRCGWTRSGKVRRASRPRGLPGVAV